jgi:hypothetical protein
MMKTSTVQKAALFLFTEVDDCKRVHGLGSPGESTSLYAFLDLGTGAPDSEMTIQPITSIRDLRFCISTNGNA